MKPAKEYLGTLKSSEPITIIGGGFSGLITGYYLDKYNIPFTIFEKEKRVGGKIQTHKSDYGLFEYSANAIFSSDLIYEILNDLELSPINSKEKLKKIVWRNNSPKSPPASKGEILKCLLKILKKTPDQTDLSLSIGQFFEPLLGKALTKEVLAPALTGIYAEDVYNLHFASVFRIPAKENERYISYLLRLKKFKKKTKIKASSLTFSGGLEELIEALRDRLKDNIQVTTKLTDLPTENTIIATDAINAAEIISTKDPEIASELEKIEYSGLTLSHSFTKHKVPYLEDAFGMVFKPNSADRNLIGVINNSAIFPNKTKSSYLNSYSFISQDISKVSNLEEDLKRIHLDGIKSNEVEFTHINWNRAIPKYNLIRFKAIENLRQKFKNQKSGLIIHGNYINGVSLRDIVENSNALAKNLAKISS